MNKTTTEIIKYEFVDDDGRTATVMEENGTFDLCDYSTNASRYSLEDWIFLSKISKFIVKKWGDSGANADSRD